MHALELIYKEFERSKFVGVFSKNCGCQVRTSYELPCAHEHALYSNAGQSIPLDSIARFWTKLDLSPCMSLEDDDIGCEEEIQKFTATFKKKSTSGKFNLLRKLRDIIAPSTSSVREPAVHNATHGRPSLKNNQN